MEKVKLQDSLQIGLGVATLASVAAAILWRKYGEDVRSIPISEHAMLDQLNRYYNFASDYYMKKATQGPGIKKPQ